MAEKKRAVVPLGRTGLTFICPSTLLIIIHVLSTTKKEIPWLGIPLVDSRVGSVEALLQIDQVLECVRSLRPHRLADHGALPQLGVTLLKQLEVLLVELEAGVHDNCRSGHDDRGSDEGRVFTNPLLRLLQFDVHYIFLFVGGSSVINGVNHAKRNLERPCRASPNGFSHRFRVLVERANVAVLQVDVDVLDLVLVDVVVADTGNTASIGVFDDQDCGDGDAGSSCDDERVAHTLSVLPDVLLDYVQFHWASFGWWFFH